MSATTIRSASRTLGVVLAAFVAAFCLASTGLRAAEVKVGDIVIDHVWARASTGGTGAVYLALHNGGAIADRLVAASTDVAKMAHLHLSKKENGVETMLLVEAIDLPAHGSVALKPGGYHVMLMGLNNPLKQGDTFPLTLTFDKAGTVNVTVAVKAAGAMGEGG